MGKSTCHTSLRTRAPPFSLKTPWSVTCSHPSPGSFWQPVDIIQLLWLVDQLPDPGTELFPQRFMCMGVLPTCVFVHAVPVKARRKCQIPWNWGIDGLRATMWVWELIPKLSEKAAMLLTTGSTLKILHPSFFNAGSKDQTQVEKFLYSIFSRVRPENLHLQNWSLSRCMLFGSRVLPLSNLMNSCISLLPGTSLVCFEMGSQSSGWPWTALKSSTFYLLPSKCWDYKLYHDWSLFQFFFALKTKSPSIAQADLRLAALPAQALRMAW